MIRVCDGTDPNLLRDDPPWDPDAGHGLRTPGRVTFPCNCGAHFDDVDYWVIYPHPAIGGGPDRAAGPL